MAEHVNFEAFSKCIAELSNVSRMVDYTVRLLRKAAGRIETYGEMDDTMTTSEFIEIMHVKIPESLRICVFYRAMAFTQVEKEEHSSWENLPIITRGVSEEELLRESKKGGGI